MNDNESVFSFSLVIFSYLQGKEGTVNFNTKNNLF